MVAESRVTWRTLIGPTGALGTSEVEESKTNCDSCLKNVELLVTLPTLPSS